MRRKPIPATANIRRQYDKPFPPLNEKCAGCGVLLKRRAFRLMVAGVLKFYCDECKEDVR